jgi:hypothetical protein
MMTGDEFRARIETLYMKREEKHSTYGALMWFGDQIGKSYSTLQRWVQGETPIPEYAVKLIELMEWQERVLSTATAQVKT